MLCSYRCLKLLRRLPRGGFTLVEIMIVVGISGLLASIAVPSYVQYRAVARKNICKANLRQLESSKERWATDNNKNTGDNCQISDLAGYIRGDVLPAEPQGGTYTVNPVGTIATCDVGSTHAIES